LQDFGSNEAPDRLITFINPDEPSLSKVEINSTQFLSWDHSHISFLVPEGQGERIHITVSVCGQESPAWTNFTYDPPKVFNFSPKVSVLLHEWCGASVVRRIHVCVSQNGRTDACEDGTWELYDRWMARRAIVSMQELMENPAPYQRLYVE
jgi:hypothetical protein